MKLRKIAVIVVALAVLAGCAACSKSKSKSFNINGTWDFSFVYTQDPNNVFPNTDQDTAAVSLSGAVITLDFTDGGTLTGPYDSSDDTFQATYTWYEGAPFNGNLTVVLIGGKEDSNTLSGEFGFSLAGVGVIAIGTFTAEKV